MCRVSVEHARGTRRAASRDRGRLVFRHTLLSVKRSGHLIFHGRLFVVRRFSRYRAEPLSKQELPLNFFFSASKQSVVQFQLFLESKHSLLRILSAGILGPPGWTSECPWPFPLLSSSQVATAPVLFHSLEDTGLQLYFFPWKKDTHLIRGKKSAHSFNELVFKLLKMAVVLRFSQL